MPKYMTKLARERSHIVAQLSIMSRDGWTQAGYDDYHKMEARLAEIDADLRVRDIKSGKIVEGPALLTKILNGGR